MLEDTLKRVGSWDKITAKEVRLSSEGWSDVDIKGLGWLTYGKDKRGTNNIRIVKVQKVTQGGQEVVRWDYLTKWHKAPVLVKKEWLTALPY